jgi:uncharacterized protein involved in exopolysaccharide biosynthesis
MSPRESYDDAEGLWDTGGEGKEDSLELPAFLLDPLGVLKRRWPVMLAAVIIGLGITGVVGWLFQPTYVAQGTLLISSQQIPEDFVRSTVPEDSIANMNAMLGEVLSQENLAQIVDRFDLYAEARDETTQLELVRRARAHIEVLPGSRPKRGETALLYALSFEHRDPVLAAEVANSLAALFVEANISRRSEQARRTTEFLRRELEGDERELREQTGLVSEFRRANRGVLPDELETNLRKIELLSQQRESLVGRIAEGEKRIAALASAPSGLLVSEHEMLLDEFRKQLARESAAHTDEHPNVAALRRRIERQERIIADERAENRRASGLVVRPIAAESQELELLKSRLAQTEAQIVERNARVDRTPTVAEQLTAMTQKVEVLREDYLSTLRKVEEAELAESLEVAQQGAQVSILDPAQPPSSPSLSRWHLLAGGVSATLVLAVGIAVLLELVDPVIVSTRQLEAIAERVALGSLPRIA